MKRRESVTVDLDANPLETTDLAGKKELWDALEAENGAIDEFLDQ